MITRTTTKQIRAGLDGSLTARAVERAARVSGHLVELLSPGNMFLCQSGVLEPLETAGLSVEEVSDGWTACGLRRGRLYLVTVPGDRSESEEG